MDLAKIRKKAKGVPREAAAAPPPPEPQAAEAAPQAPPPPPPPEPTVPDPPQASEPSTPPAQAPGSVEARRAGAEPVPAPDKAEAAPSGPLRLEKLLVFAVGRRRYAIPIHDISQIIEEQSVTPVPHAPTFLLGIFSLRGRIVSVLDAALRLGLPSEGEAQAPKVVVLDAGEELFGIRVHAIDQVVEVDLGTLEPPPESFLTQGQEFVEGVFHHRERTVSFLNLPLFLAFEAGGNRA